jgi:hypothetical protein
MPAMTESVWQRMSLPADLVQALDRASSVTIPRTRRELVELSLGGNGADVFEVGYEVPSKGWTPEATIVRCRNGVAVNYVDPYLRRRDPDSMVVADDLPTDKPLYDTRFDVPFATLRSQVIDWLQEQPLLLLPFLAGNQTNGYPSLLVAPMNAAFFAAALADIQGMLPPERIPKNFSPQAIVYLAPPFRHTHCGGKQVVIHHRADGLHELFSLNLYPGPSAKKGIYGVLLNIGENENWLTVHGSTVQVITPYDNILTLMHEGASGGGKSEMLQYSHREPDGRLLLGENVVTGERRLVAITQGCELRPVTDDMALAHPSLRNESGKLVVEDAEQAWFVRVNHIDRYGVDPHLESICARPAEPLVFLNMYAVPRSTCLIWEHAEDAPGQPCPNPRVILPRRLVPDIVDGPVEVDVRSFGVRTPPCTRERPTYGILGILHFLPPALGWLWRLVAPRGYDNPSITDSVGMSSEGVGSYWPFATGLIVDHANLLLEQIRQTRRTRYTISPNQHVGAWRTGFAPQWLAREYLARRGGARFKPGQLVPAECPLLGYVPKSMHLEGSLIPNWFLQVETQPEVGLEAYAAGAKILHNFFRQQLQPYLDFKEFDPLGRKIVERALGGADSDEFAALLPSA